MELEYSHDDNDKRFCVYFFTLQDDTIIYVGSGNRRRLVNKIGRSKEILSIWHDIKKFIVIDGLSKEESLIEEQKIIDWLEPFGNLKNKVKVTKGNTLKYEDLTNFLYISEDSPTMLRWKVDRSNNKNRTTVRAGDVAGGNKGGGYLSVKVCGKTLNAHRVVWVLHNKCDLAPNLVIDHIDRNRSNNNPSNLRAVTHQENTRNRKGRTETSRIIKIKDRPYIAAVYRSLKISKKKNFNYGKLFPGVNEVEAIELASELAKAWLADMDALHGKS